MLRQTTWLLGALLCAELSSLARAALAPVYSFEGRPNSGSEPQTDLLLYQGYLYGTTVSGGLNDFGTVFRIQPDGSDYQLLYSFESSGPNAAAGPQGSIVIANNSVYGIVNGGGPAAAGRIYRVGIDGSGIQFLHNFAGGLANDGADPFGGLILDQGVLYGTTSRGGSGFNRGAVFKLNLDGSDYQMLKAFDFANTGGSPQGSLLKIGGVLYGTTSAGISPSTNGTVFKLNDDGTGFSLLHQFAGGPSDGRSAIAGLVTDGNRLYGATVGGGANNGGTIYALDFDGSDYELLHSFETVSGTGPEAALTLIGDTLYGATRGAGIGGTGSLFQIDTTGENFETLADTLDVGGISPETALALVDNRLYGTTRFSNGGDGLIYSFDLPAETLVGDANGDCTVGAADYAIWAAQFGQTGPGLSADFDGNGSVGAGDYALWAANFGNTCPPSGKAAPEPAGLVLALLGLLGLAGFFGRCGAQRRRG